MQERGPTYYRVIVDRICNNWARTKKKKSVEEKKIESKKKKVNTQPIAQAIDFSSIQTPGRYRYICVVRGMRTANNVIANLINICPTCAK